MTEQPKDGLTRVKLVRGKRGSRLWSENIAPEQLQEAGYEVRTFIDAESLAGLFEEMAMGSDYGLPAAIWKHAARLVREGGDG